MASGLSETSIYNMVLDRLVEESVLGTTDDKAVTRWLGRNLPVQRDVLLMSHPWNFAIKRAALATDVATPAFEWRYSYTLPSDCLRVLPLTVGGKRDAPGIPHVIESGKILTDASAPLYVRYIFREDNPARWTPMFGNLLAQILAAYAAHWLTGKATFADNLQRLVTTLTNQATLIDALEGTPEPPDDHEIITARY